MQPFWQDSRLGFPPLHVIWSKCRALLIHDCVPTHLMTLHLHADLILQKRKQGPERWRDQPQVTQLEAARV